MCIRDRYFSAADSSVVKQPAVTFLHTVTPYVAYGTFCSALWVGVTLMSAHYNLSPCEDTSPTSANHVSQCQPKKTTGLFFNLLIVWRVVTEILWFHVTSIWQSLVVVVLVSVADWVSPAGFWSHYTVVTFMFSDNRCICLQVKAWHMRGWSVVQYRMQLLLFLLTYAMQWVSIRFSSHGIK